MSLRPRPEFHLPVFGTSSPDAVVAAIAEFAAAHLAAMVDVSFYWVSHGAVAGVDLADGRRVACKFLSKDYERLDVLDACRNVQLRALTAGLPAPRPIAGPITWGGAVCLVDEWRPSPLPLDGRQSLVREGLARLLGEVVAGINPINEPVLGRTRHALPSAPPASGDGTVDNVVAEAHRHLIAAARVGEPVAGHFDWRTQNVHVTLEGKSLVIYDWDSTVIDLEERIVGAAAAMFSIVMGAPNSSVPTPEDTRAFVLHYEQQRGHYFNADQRDTVAAAALYKLGTQAVAEHGWDPEGDRIDHRSPRLALRTYGADGYEQAITRAP